MQVAKDNKYKPKSDVSDAAHVTPDSQDDEVMGAINELRKGLADLDASLSGRLSKLEIAAPVEVRRLGLDSVATIIKGSSYAEFEVLQNWTHHGVNMQAGRRVRADHYPELLDYMRGGLQVGMPEDQDAVIDKYREEARALEARNLAEQKLTAQRDVAAANKKAAELDDKS